MAEFIVVLVVTGLVFTLVMLLLPRIIEKGKAKEQSKQTTPEPTSETTETENALIVTCSNFRDNFTPEAAERRMYSEIMTFVTTDEINAKYKDAIDRYKAFYRTLCDCIDKKDAKGLRGLFDTAYKLVHEINWHSFRLRNAGVASQPKEEQKIEVEEGNLSTIDNKDHE